MIVDLIKNKIEFLEIIVIIMINLIVVFGSLDIVEELVRYQKK